MKLYEYLFTQHILLLLMVCMKYEMVMLQLVQI